MLAQLSTGGALFLSNSGDKCPKLNPELEPSEKARWTAFSAHVANLLQSKVSYG